MDHDDSFYWSVGWDSQVVNFLHKYENFTGKELSNTSEEYAMSTRGRFEQKLTELRADILAMGSLVDEELQLALEALRKLDPELAKAVNEKDVIVNPRLASPSKRSALP